MGLMHFLYLSSTSFQYIKGSTYLKIRGWNCSPVSHRVACTKNYVSSTPTIVDILQVKTFEN